MGLDQFLFKKTKYNDGSEGLDELMYWRKANYIQKYFNNILEYGVENCENHGISIEDLKHLKECCKAVIENNDLAEDLLPTVGGFFYGSTDYDEWYFSSVENTYEKLDKIINEYDGEELIYHAWW